MTRDVAAARAAVGQAALARDQAALRAIADSLPALTAYAYERHRARAFANAIRGAHDSAVAELCLGVAACPPTASTFVADSAQLRLLTDGLWPAPVDRRPRRSRFAGTRLVASGAALAAAVAALVVLPVHVFEDTRPETAGVTAPSRTAPPRVVVADRPDAPTRSEPRAPDAPDAGAQRPDGVTLVAVGALRPAGTASSGSAARTDPPAPRAAVAKPRPRPTTPRPVPPSTPQAPPPVPSEPAAAPEPSATAAAAPAPTQPDATTSTRERKGKALGKTNAPGRLKQEPGPPPPTPAAAPPAAQPPAAPSSDPQPPGPPEPHPGRGHGRDRGP